MNPSSKFEQMDIYKAIVFVVLLAILIVLVIASNVDSGRLVEGGAQAATPTMMEAEKDETVTSESEVAKITSTATPKESTIIQELPPFPHSTLILRYNSVLGGLVAPDGRVVYVLSADKKIWLPNIPEDLADKLGTTTAKIDAQGVWIITSPDGEEQYHWDQATLSWVKVTVALPTAEGETPEETPIPVAEVTVTATLEPSVAPTITAKTQMPAVSVTPMLPIPTSTPGTPKSYVLQTGEYVYCVARRFNVNPEQLLAANGLTYSSTVFKGMKLTIPQNADPFPGKRSLRNHPAWYEVKKGETVYSIACTFGDVQPYAIIYANQLSEPYAVQAGDVLYIP